MQIPKDKILEMIHSRGHHDQDQSLLAKFGISPDDLIEGPGSTFGM